MGDVTFPADVLKRFNQVFQDVKEGDRDRYGLLTPGDILAGEGSEAEKAIKIRDYLARVGAIDLDDNPATKDVFVYRDASTTALSIKVGDSFRAVFSINYADTEDCFITYPEDHYNISIPSSQCRLVRAAHPMIEGLKAEYLNPETWISEEDRKVLIPANRIEAANKDLIRLANEAKVGVQMDTPAMMWDIFDLPAPLTLGKIHEAKIEIPKYPFIRDAGDAPIRELTEGEMKDVLASTNIKGEISVSQGGKLFSLTIDKEVLDRPMTPQYGWIVNRTDMKGLPTEKQLLNYAADDDHIQWTALNSEQPVVIVGEAIGENSTKWYHVLAYKVWGWVKAEDVALISKEKAEKMWTNPDVLTVTNPSLIVNGHFLEMATRLQILSETNDSFTVILSKRSETGNYDKETVKIKKADVSDNAGQADFYKGRVPFSRENKIKLLFKYLGTPWAMANERRGDDVAFPHQGGNRKLYIDCSGIIEKAMDAMGLYAFSRTSKWQVRQGDVLWEKKEGAVAVENALERFGEKVWLIGMPGHVMFYLGARDGQHWMIHSPGHFRKYAGNSDDFIRNGDGQAVVSPITLSDLNKKFDVLMSPNH